MSVTVEARNRGGVSFAVIALEILPVALIVMLLSAVGMVHVTSRVLVVSMGYELSKLDTRATELDREHAQLKLELATLKSPSRLEAIARTRLNMQQPAATSIIHVKTN